jgi:hypothetical protein
MAQNTATCPLVSSLLLVYFTLHSHILMLLYITLTLMAESQEVARVKGFGYKSM